MASGSVSYLTTSERTNYARLCRAIVDLCTDVYREVLSTITAPCNLKIKLSTCTDLRKSPFYQDEQNKLKTAVANNSYSGFDITLLHKLITILGVQEMRDNLSICVSANGIWTKIQAYPAIMTTFTKEQMIKLQEASSITKDYSGCDCYILSQLIDHLCPGYCPKIIPSRKKWGGSSLPSPTETEFGDDIERIRILKNKVYSHTPSTSIPVGEFQSIWQELEGVMIRMDNMLKPSNAYAKHLHLIKTECMDDKLNECILKVEELVKTTEQEADESGKMKRKIEILDIETEHIKKKVLHLELQASQDSTDRIREQNRIIVESWKREDKIFVETRGTRAAFECINTNNTLTVIGNSGIGKSATIQHIALSFEAKGYEIFEIYSPLEMKEHFHPKKNQVFVANDPVGKHSLDKERFKTWVELHSRLSTCLSQTQSKLLCSIRRQVAGEPDFAKDSFILNSNVIDLQNSRLNLDEDEKICILKRHLLVNECEIKITKDVEKILREVHELFPLMCKLFSSSKIFQKSGWDFFQKPQKPFELVFNDLDNMKMYDRKKYCTLVVCFANGNVLRPWDFELFAQIENDEIKENNDKIIRACGLSNEAFEEALVDNLSSLDEVYLRREGNVFRFCHDLIHDVVSYHFGKKYPVPMIKYSPSRFICERVLASKDLIGNDPYIIVLEKRHFKLLFDRLISDLDKGMYNHVLMNKCWRDASFMGTFKREFENNKESIIELFSRNLEQSPVYIDESTYELKHLNIQQRVSWYCITMILLNAEGITALHWVVAFAHKSLFFSIWNNLSSEQKRTIRKCVPLIHLAILGRDLEICTEILLEEGHLINAPFSEKETVYCNNYFLDYLPLHLAAWSTSDIAKLLLDNGADVHCVQLKGQNVGGTALEWASICNNANVASVLLHHCFRSVASHNTSERVLEKFNFDPEQMRQRKAIINARCNKKLTPLIWAARYNSTDMVLFLLQNDAEVDSQDMDGMTALIKSVRDDYIESTKILLEHNADVNIQDNDGRSALMIASENNSYRTARMLFEHNPEINLQTTKDRLTALMIASKRNYYQMVELLLLQNADRDLVDKDGKTALQIAEENNCSDVIQLLKDKNG